MRMNVFWIMEVANIYATTTLEAFPVIAMMGTFRMGSSAMVSRLEICSLTLLFDLS